MSTLVIGDIEAAAPGRRISYLRACMGIAAVSTLALSIAWLLGTRALSETLAAVSDHWLSILLFILASVSLAAGSVQDAAGQGLARSSRQTVRSVIQGSLRILLLLLLRSLMRSSWETILLAWTLPVTPSILIVGRFLGLEPSDKSFHWKEVRGQLLPALKHHVLTLSLVSTTVGFPVIIASVSRPTDVAWFNVSKNIASAVLLLPFVLSISLFTTTVNNPQRLGSDLRRTLFAGLLMSGGLIVGVALFGRLVLSVYGGFYAKEGTASLLVLVCGGPFYLIRDQWVMVERVHGRMVGAAIKVGLCSAFELALIGCLAAEFGIIWGCIGWVGCLSAEMVLFAPPVVRAARWRGAHALAR